MKTIGACFMSSGLTAILMLFLFPFDSGERCETVTIQQQAGYQVVVQAQRGIIDDYTTRLDGKRRELVAVQHELASRMAKDVTIPEPKPIKVSEVVSGGTVYFLAKNAGCVQYETDGRRGVTCQDGYAETDEIRALAKDVTPIEQAARATNDTAWWKQIKAEHIKDALKRLTGQVPAPRIP